MGLQFEEGQFPAEQPIEAPLVTQQKAKEQAYYMAALMSPDQMEMVFDQVMDDLTQKGYSAAYSNAKVAWANEQLQSNKQVISELMFDESIDKKTKLQILTDYSSTGYISNDIRDKYIKDVAVLDNSSTYLEQEAQDQNIDDLQTQLAIDNQGKQVDANTSLFEKVVGEGTAIFNVGVSIIPGIVGFGARTNEAIRQYNENGYVDWDSIGSLQERLPDDSTLKKVLSLSARPLAKLVGAEDEFDESFTNETVLANIGKFFEWMAEKAVEKNFLGLTNKEQALYAMEAIGFLLPPGYYAAKAGLKRIKHPKGSPMDTTSTANPKVAGEVATAAVTEAGGEKLAQSAGTSVQAVVAENVLPKIDDTPNTKHTPDILDRLDEVYKDLDPYDQAKLDLMFDDNIIDKAERLTDLERIVNVHKDTNLNYSQANSWFNMLDEELQGRMVFSKNSDYPLTTKAEVKRTVDQLKEAVAELPENERGMIRVRDLKTQKTYDASRLNSIKKDRGQFHVEWEFSKQYKLLDNEMLGKGLADEQISFFGIGTNFAKKLAQSSAGEFIFGTGATARWYEQARQAASPRAAAVRDTILVKTNSLIANNRALHKDINKLIKNMELEGKDTFSMAELSRMHKDLDTKQLAKLDEIQTEWRKAQDTLFEITNLGYKNQLVSQGFNRGVFIQGKYKGPGRLVERDLTPDAAPTKVIDLASGKVVDFVPDVAKGNKFNTKGQQLVRLYNKEKVGNDRLEYGVLGRDVELRVLPNQVINKIPGHSYKEYKSHFFVEAIPLSLSVNGKKIDKFEIQRQYAEVKGTATTKYEADALAEQIKKELGDDYVVEPRTSREGDLSDFVSEYRLMEDDYKNALSRNRDIKTVGADPVLKDPLEALNNAANRITKTAAYSPFDKAFKQAFERDFKEVLKDGTFPSSIDDIGQFSKRATPEMIKDAKMVWNRHTHFQNQAGNPMDAWFQSSLHSLADVFEKVKLDDKLLLKGAAVKTRDIANLGAYPVTGFPKKLATLALITFQLPLRHLVIQPMMFYEQSLIFPKTFGSTMKKTPIMVMDLLSGHPLLKEHGTRLKTFLKKTEIDEYNKEITALRKLGVLQSIDQNLAVMEMMRGTPRKIETPNILSRAYETTRNVFNKYGFTAGELSNRVGLFLQTKERWKAANPGKDWTKPAALNRIADDAWRQSGAMTAAGALRFQQMPLLSFLTQFQSINHKGFMNLIQDNATNLSKADRAKLMGTRLLMHGAEFGVPLAGGKVLMDYLMSHEDETLRESADLVRRGFLDLSFSKMMSLMTGESADFSVSEGSSISATNFYADMYEQMANVARFVSGDSRAQAPNIASLDVMFRGMERFQAAIDMFKTREITDANITDYIGELSRITSAGNNIAKSRTAMALHDIYTKQGNAKGLDITYPEALAQMAGFKTRREIDQWRQQELQIDIESKIKTQIVEFDRQIVNSLKQGGSPEQFASIINLQINALEQAGVFSPSQMDRIISGVMEKDRRRFDSNRTDSMINYFMNSDAKDADMREFLARFKSHPDPVIQQLVKQYEGKL